MSTIVALSSGQGRAGIAVIRLSGPDVRFVIETIWRRPLAPRHATRLALRDPASGAVIDDGLGLFFPAPNSATGEDVLELHLHGSPGVVRAALRLLTGLAPGIRLATPGEFSRRALSHGKLDLLGVEALGDLLEAETELQVSQARRLMDGGLANRVHDWRARLTELRSWVEAELDFSDEADVEDGWTARARLGASDIAQGIEALLEGAARGARIREGAVVAIVGAPNVGKSSLINALAGRSVAIVSEIPGTTRDALEAPVSIRGWPVVLVDTAGLRHSDDPIEKEGVRRARSLLKDASLVLAARSPDRPGRIDGELPAGTSVIHVGMKSDLGEVDAVDVAVSAQTGDGIEALMDLIASRLDALDAGEPPLVSRERQRTALRDAASALRHATELEPAELVAEELRRAHQALGRLVGEVDIESVLDRLFAGFCIGK